MNTRDIRSAVRAFSLIETAIVLAVVGLVIGGIWVAAAAVHYRYQESRLIQGFLSYKSNVEQYLTQTSPCTATIPNDGNYLIYTYPALDAVLYPKEWSDIKVSRFLYVFTDGFESWRNTAIACDAAGTRFFRGRVITYSVAKCEQYRTMLISSGAEAGSCAPQQFDFFWPIPRRS